MVDFYGKNVGQYTTVPWMVWEGILKKPYKNLDLRILTPQKWSQNTCVSYRFMKTPPCENLADSKACGEVIEAPKNQPKKPSKIKWDLANGPLSKLLEVLDPQVWGSVQWVLLVISWKKKQTSAGF